MLRYSVGYLFSDTFKTVLVIDKPNKGLINGLGGKMLDDEEPKQAMQREFKEETLDTDIAPDWHMFSKLAGVDDKGREFECYFFYATVSAAEMWTKFGSRVIHNNEGDVYPESVEELILGRKPVISNLPWLLVMAVSVAKKQESCSLFAIQEARYHDTDVHVRAVEDRQAVSDPCRVS